MESLGDALKHLEILGAISRDHTDPSSSAEDEDTAAAEAEPSCPRCGGAGFVRRDVPVGHPDFGHAFPCACRRIHESDEHRARLERLSNLGPLTRLTFDNLVKEGRAA